MCSSMLHATSAAPRLMYNVHARRKLQQVINWCGGCFIRDGASCCCYKHLLLRQMHNWRRCATDVPCNFTIKSLALLAVVYLHLMSLASGIAVPGGLFMPSIMVRTH